VLIRQNGPVFGSSNPYASRGETQVDVSTRNLRSTDHFVGTEEQLQRQSLDTFVENTQHMIDVSVTRQMAERLSMTVALPFVAASWGIPSPTSPVPGPRADEASHGLGDLTVGARYWLLPTSKFKTGNIAAGASLKMPTGNAGYKAIYVDRNGQNPMPRYVDQSVQPGDGGWGVVMQLQGFKTVGRVAQVFASATYLMNPRDTNDTTSGSINRTPTALLPPDTSPTSTSFNSVPDQFMANAGVAVPLGRSGIAASIAWRLEGLPRYDLIGESHGFRRPGAEMFIEPGISFAKGRRIYGFQMPIAYYRNRFPNPYTGSLGDATFPNYIFLASVGYRFGSKAQTAICEQVEGEQQ